MARIVPGAPEVLDRHEFNVGLDRCVAHASLNMTVPVSMLPRRFDRLVPGDGGAAVAARKVEYLDAHDEMTVDLHGPRCPHADPDGGEEVHGGRRSPG